MWYLVVMERDGGRRERDRQSRIEHPLFLVVGRILEIGGQSRLGGGRVVVEKSFDQEHTHTSKREEWKRQVGTGPMDRRTEGAVVRSFS